jgi:ribosome-binding protein aMBF1 (putative translation factor)
MHELMNDLPKRVPGTQLPSWPTRDPDAPPAGWEHDSQLPAGPTGEALLRRVLDGLHRLDRLDPDDQHRRTTAHRVRARRIHRSQANETLSSQRKAFQPMLDGEVAAFRVSVRDQFRQARQRLGWTLAELAEHAAGVSPELVASYERGEADLGVFEFQQLCSALELDVLEVLREAQRRAVSTTRAPHPE